MDRGELRRQRKAEARERVLAKAARPAFSAPQVKRRRARRADVASREEQRATYLDCGPGAWDDRD